MPIQSKMNVLTIKT